MNLRPLLIVAALATPALGQSPAVKTSLLTLSLDSKIEDAFFNNGGEVQPFQADRTGFGATVKYVGPRQFILRGSAEEFAEPPPGPPPLSAVLLPEKASMVLLVGGRAGEDQLKLAAYDISPGDFRAGDYRLFNFSNEALSVVIGTHKFALQPGADRIVSQASWREKIADIPVRIASMEDGKPRQVYASIWGHQSVKRNYIFLLNGSHPTRPVGIRRFSDYPD